jgi:hypothetical protein
LKRSMKKSDHTRRFIWFLAFPHLPLTRKPNGIRMGKGKGKLECWKIMELDNQQRSSEQENVQRSSPRRGVGRIISSEMVGLHNCVYCLKDSRDLKVRYIGKTVCSLKKRLGEHLQDSRRHNTKVVVQYRLQSV